MSEAQDEVGRTEVSETASGLVPGELFDPAFLAKLERLELLARRVLKGWVRGEHASTRRGRGLEFADHRPYHPGDDLRYIDWHIFSRLEQLFLKLYANEEDLTLSVVLDASASMRFGSPRKFDYARQLVAALAYIGLNNLDRVVLSAFNDGVTAALHPLKSRASSPSALGFLSELECGGTTRFLASMREAAERSRNPGLVVLVSDLLGVEGVEAGIDALRYRGHDVVVIQVLAEEEIEPPLDGAYRLIDVEDGKAVQVTVDRPLRQAYAARLAAELDRIERYARAAGIEYLRASTAISLEDVMLRYLRQGSHWQ